MVVFWPFFAEKGGGSGPSQKNQKKLSWSKKGKGGSQFFDSVNHQKSPLWLDSVTVSLFANKYYFTLDLTNRETDAATLWERGQNHLRTSKMRQIWLWDELAITKGPRIFSKESLIIRWLKINEKWQYINEIWHNWILAKNQWNII